MLCRLSSGGNLIRHGARIFQSCDLVYTAEIVKSESNGESEGYGGLAENCEQSKRWVVYVPEVFSVRLPRMKSQLYTCRAAEDRGQEDLVLGGQMVQDVVYVRDEQ